MTYEELRAALAWEPVIEGTRPSGWKGVVVGAMGGSALPANAARFLDPRLLVAAHRDYDLPEGLEEDSLYVAISYSGTTEETLAFAEKACERELPLAVITTGADLGNFAREHELPHVIIPGGLQPRNALLYQLRALLALIGADEQNRALASVQFDAATLESEASALGGKLADGLPLFYSSRPNGFLAYVAKVQFNETAKMPAYANAFPELNHNEMQSFDSMAPESIGSLARFVLLGAATDDPRVAKRMELFGELMRERRRTVIEQSLSGTTRAEMLARNWFLLHRAAVATAIERGVDPNAIPLVAEFKERL